MITTSFAADLNVERLIMGLELYTGHKINPENTLLMVGLRQRTLLDGNDAFTQFKGILTEQYVIQPLYEVENFAS